MSTFNKEAQTFTTENVFGKKPRKLTRRTANEGEKKVLPSTKSANKSLLGTRRQSSPPLKVVEPRVVEVVTEISAQPIEVPKDAYDVGASFEKGVLNEKGLLVRASPPEKGIIQAAIVKKERDEKRKKRSKERTEGRDHKLNV
jgi:hypothetical protein